MTGQPLLPTRAPRSTRETAEFWDGCAAGKLVLPRCDDCGEVIWYPRSLCPFCASTSTTNVEMSGAGTLYSFSIVRKGSGPFREHAPYVVAIVELDEGPRMMTNVVGADPETLAVGARVRVVFDPVLDDTGTQVAAIPRFTPNV